MAIATQYYAGTLSDSICDMTFYFLNRGFINQWTLRGFGQSTLTYFKLADLGAQFGGKSIKNTIVYKQAVRTHAGLARIAELAHQRAFNRSIQVSILKHNKGGVTAEF